MIRRPRERLLQMLVYEHYVRPHFDFFELATAERRLIHAFDLELNGGAPSNGSADLVRRWFDKAWRRAEREWAELRDGGKHAFYRSRVSAETSGVSAETPGGNGEGSAQAAPAERGAAPTGAQEDPSQLALPTGDADVWERALSAAPPPAPAERGAATVGARPRMLP